MRMHPTRRWPSLPTWRSLLLAAGAVAVTSVPAICAGAAGATRAHTWADYFYPLKVGWTCHETVNSGGVTGTETLTVASIGTVPGGRSITVDEGSSSTADGRTVPTNSALRYVLTSKGGLVTVPSSGQLAGQAYRIDGSTVYPSVQTLLGGGSSTSRLHISLPLAASDLTELKGVLPPKTTDLDMTVSVRQTGTVVPTLSTPGGSLDDALAVHSVLKSITVTNALKSATKELDAALKPVVAKELVTTTWFELDRGPVKFTFDGITGYVTDCGLNASTPGGTGGTGTGGTGTTATTGNSGGTRT
jgi:hypothetical protein